MPSFFVAVRCCECGTFQVQQKGKSKKWRCRAPGCGKRQSYVRVYARSGRARDCRGVVQELSYNIGMREEEKMEKAIDAEGSGDDEDDLADASPVSSSPRNGRVRLHDENDSHHRTRSGAGSDSALKRKRDRRDSGAPVLKESQDKCRQRRSTAWDKFL